MKTPSLDLTPGPPVNAGPIRLLSAPGKPIGRGTRQRVRPPAPTNGSRRPTPKARSTSGIKDFGHHIPGARKDAMSAAILAAPERYSPSGPVPKLTELWPGPTRGWKNEAAARAEAGEDPERLALYRALRDSLEGAPARRLEIEDAAGGRRTRCRTAADVLNGTITVDEAFASLTPAPPSGEARGMSEPEATARLRTRAYVLSKHAIDARKYGCTINDDGELGGRECHIHACSMGWRHAGSRLSEVEPEPEWLAEELVKLATPYRGNADTGSKPRYHLLYVKDSSEPDGRRYGVYRRFGGKWRLLTDVANADEGRRIVLEETERLDEYWERWKKTPPERRAENRRRTPDADDATTSPPVFQTRFGLRGVQFGNWVENERRRLDLADASQGFADLAKVLGWQESMMSLGGRLALSFGARGNGGRHKAHYESGQIVIAISKPNGPGSLAHEWMHALDDHQGEGPGAGRHARFASDSAFDSWATLIEPLITLDSGLTGRMRPADILWHLLSILGRFVEDSRWADRSKALDRRRTKPYWGTTPELTARTFEAWVIAKLAKADIVNDYLANVVDEHGWAGDPDLGQRYPYPMTGELEGSRAEKTIDAIAELGRRYGTRIWEYSDNG